MTDEPPEFPDSGEAEDHVLGKPHSPTASETLGELWEVANPSTATIVHSEPVVSTYES